MRSGEKRTLLQINQVRVERRQKALRERGEVDKYLPIFFRLCSTQCLPMDAGSVVVRKEKKLTPVTRRPHDSEKVRRR